MGKYSDWTRGNVEALLNIIGEERARALLAGDLTVSFGEAVKKLFDNSGRRIPQGLSAAVCDPNQDFIKQPEVNYSEHLKRLEEKLGVKTKVTARVFRKATERLLATIREDPQIANCLSGTYLPVVLPQLTDEDLGTVLEQYLKAVDSLTSYHPDFPGRVVHYRQGTFAGQVLIVAESRHEQLIARMRQKPVLGIHFPNPLQGFSVDASREQMSSLPERFSLSGLDTLIALIMYPEILDPGCRCTPALDLAALSGRHGGSLFCKADYATHFDFDYTERLSTHASGRYSSGLFFS